MTKMYFIFIEFHFDPIALRSGSGDLWKTSMYLNRIIADSEDEISISVKILNIWVAE